MTRRSILVSLAVVFAPLVGAPVAHAAAPVLAVKATWGDTNLPPAGKALVDLFVRNVGDGDIAPGLTVTDQLPEQLTIEEIKWGENSASDCSGTGTHTLSCEVPSSDTTLLEYGQALGDKAPGGETVVPAGFLPTIEVVVAVDSAAQGAATNTATASGGAAAQAATATDRMSFSPAPALFGIVPGSFLADVYGAAFPFGSPSRQAGDHPFEYRVNFDFNLYAIEFPNHASDALSVLTQARDKVRTVEVTLPRGMTGNPEATPKCDPALFARRGPSESQTQCPADTQVGSVNVPVTVFGGEAWKGLGAIYNLVPPKGTLSDLAFNIAGATQAHIFATLDPAHDYAIKTVSPNIAAFAPLDGAQVTVWGVPADPAHDRLRYYPEAQAEKVVLGAPFGSAAIRPFLTNPIDCGEENGGSRIRVDSYEHPGELTPAQEYGDPLNVTGCEDPRLRFEPDISLEPTDHHAGAPTGLEVKLRVPQRNDEAKNAQELYAENGYVKGIATPPIKKTVVTLPEGMTLNPSAGQGLTGCSLEQLGMSASGVPNGEPVRCPTTAQIGTLIMHSPDLPENEPLTGRVYIAKQGENPFGSLFALYLVLENAERGVLVKLAGKIELDPVTGQIKTTFDDLPQFPVSDFSLKFKSGPRAALVNPSTCGRKTITAEYFSWQDPNTPHVAYDSYDITQNPDGGPCVYSTAQWPFNLQFSAGTVNPVAGAFSPFTLRLTRGDTEQQLSGLSLTLPPGLLGKIAGVGQCPDANIAAAMALDHAGQGATELASPSCPASSLIGESLVSAGTGPSLTYVPGKVYFAGPYKGAPFSVVVITPSVVGPYDLGDVTVRNALFIDPITAQAHVVSDPLPKILDGIPVRIRDLRIDLNRPGFMFNPTDCAEEQIAGSASAFEGATDMLSDRFQAANCATLGFQTEVHRLHVG